MSNPLDPIRSLAAAQRYIRHVARQRLSSRYANTLLGYGWLILQPLIFLAALGFIRVFVFGSAWPAPSGGTAGPAVTMAAVFIGLIVFWFVSEPLIRAPSVLREFRGTIKNELVPLDSLVGVLLVESVIQTTLRLGILFVGLLCFGLIPSVHVLVLPLVLLPLVMAVLGIGWLFAGLGLYYRDLEHVLPPVFSALFFVSAVFFPVAGLPPAVQEILLINPIAFAIESCRETILWHAWPDWSRLGLYILLGFLVMWLGWQLFNDRRGKYVDAL